MFIYILVLSIITFVNAISGGHDTNITRHKWTLSLQHNNDHFCGAALIAPTWALTSAGCVQIHSDNLSVRAASTNRTSGGQVVDVQTVIVHPNYNAKTHDSDIALLQFSEEINPNITIAASLPYIMEDVKDESSTYLTGWGITEPNGSFPENLQFLQVPVIPREECQAAYPGIVINLNMFCVGWMKNGDRTACDGDYGGPGIIMAFLQGIVSWGKGCGVAKYPTVLTRVLNYIGWISENTGINITTFSPIDVAY